MTTPTLRMPRLPQVTEPTGRGRDSICWMGQTGDFLGPRTIRRKARPFEYRRNLLNRSPFAKAVFKLAVRQGGTQARRRQRRLRGTAAARQRPAHFAPARARRSLHRPSRGIVCPERGRRTARRLRNRSRDDREFGHGGNADGEEDDLRVCSRRTGSGVTSR